MTSWEAPIVNWVRLRDPERAVFFMLRGGGDNGLVNADFSKFGAMTNLVLDLHDYDNGLYGSGYTADHEGWVPSWDATHNQNFLDYHGTEQALVENIGFAVNRTRALGIPLVRGEWGAQTADTGVLDFQHHLLSVMQRYGLSWARWNLGQGADPFTMLTRTKLFNAVVMPSDLGSTLRVAVRARSSAGRTAVRTAVTAPVTPNVLAIANLKAGVSPISPCVTISFDLHKAAAVKIVIRDTTGAIVKKLDNADRPAGFVVKRWGEVLDNGLPAPQGTYTALVTATSSTEFTSTSVAFTI